MGILGRDRRGARHVAKERDLADVLTDAARRPRARRRGSPRPRRLSIT